MDFVPKGLFFTLNFFKINIIQKIYSKLKIVAIKGGLTMEDKEKYERAKKRVQNLKDFYTHLTVYILINILLVIINVVSYQGHWWFFYPLLGWGIGLTAHAVSTFAYFRFGASWEERKIKEYMEKDKEV